MINIYVGNLPYSVKSDELREAFSAFGEVTSAEVIFDRRTKRSRGYGFVEMSDDGDGRAAIAEMNGKDFKGRELRVDESQSKDKSNRKRAPGSGSERHDGGNNDRKTTPVSEPTAGGGVVGFFKKLFG